MVALKRRNFALKLFENESISEIEGSEMIAAGDTKTLR
jgi:hypothetical protein